MPGQLTLEELTRILQDAAGVTEGVDLSGDILDVSFEDLGYDSLALLETSGRIERERGIELEETTVTDAKTPRALLALVNDLLGAPA